MAEEKEDPGLATSYDRPTKRIINKDGSFNVVRRGGIQGVRDFYQSLVRMSWTKFMFMVVSFYLIINALFAVIYVAIGVENLSGGVYRDGMDAFLYAFYFSCQTFTTVGYGAISPTGAETNVVAAIEALTGLLAFALATGLVYGRFSKPDARIDFSERAIVAPYRENGRALMFRIVNLRNHVLQDMEARVTVVLRNQLATRATTRTFFRLDLEIDHINYFPLSWTIVHPLDENSPLSQFTYEDLVESGAEMLIQIKGFDDMFGQTVFNRHSYLAEEIDFNRKFVRIFSPNEHGDVILDIDRLSETEPADIPQPEPNTVSESS